MPSNPLRDEERVAIEVGVALGQSNVEIARELSRCPSTIGSEINRNGGRAAYSAVKASKRAVACSKRPKIRKVDSDPELGRHVLKRTLAGDSPLTISIELERGIGGLVRRISPECIYQSRYDRSCGLFRAIKPKMGLRATKRKPRGAARPANSDRLAGAKSVHDRPSEASDRSRVGDLEGDLIVGRNNQSAMVTVFDRKSRRLWMAHTRSKSADHVLEALLKLLSRIPRRARRTLTWDRGAEIQHWAELERRRGIDIYICDPKSPWQRPTNENGNALIRRYVGKGTDLNLITPRSLTKIETRINTIPRKSLGFLTAIDHYHQELAMTS